MALGQRRIEVKGYVLVVDDVKESRDSFEALLAAEGYEAAVAVDSGKGLELMAGRRPDVVLFAVLSPAKSAIDFVRQFGLNREAVRVPVVILTRLDEYQMESFLNGVPGVRKIVRDPCPAPALLNVVARSIRVVR